MRERERERERERGTYVFPHHTPPSPHNPHARSHNAHSGLVPLAALSKEGDGALAAIDAGLALALPVHSHIALNYVVSDYVPKSFRGPARWGVLASTVLATLGLARLALSEPGVTGTVKRLWSPSEADRVAAAAAKEAGKKK